MRIGRAEVEQRTITQLELGQLAHVVGDVRECRAVFDGVLAMVRGNHFAHVIDALDEHGIDAGLCRRALEIGAVHGDAFRRHVNAPPAIDGYAVRNR
ncbi:hypothetical protein D3C71_1896640 [compost metagenome]